MRLEDVNNNQHNSYVPAHSLQANYLTQECNKYKIEAKYFFDRIYYNKEDEEVFNHLVKKSLRYVNEPLFLIKKGKMVKIQDGRNKIVAIYKNNICYVLAKDYNELLHDIYMRKIPHSNKYIFCDNLEELLLKVLNNK